MLCSRRLFGANKVFPKWKQAPVAQNAAAKEWLRESAERLVRIVEKNILGLLVVVGGSY
jgi:hypothetical protein